MIYVTPCEQPMIRQMAFRCADASSIKAELRRMWHAPIPLGAVPGPDTGEDTALEFGPVPADTGAGVWHLVVTTDCGCFTAQVYVNCPAPEFVPVYTKTNIGWPMDDTAPPECDTGR